MISNKDVVRVEKLHHIEQWTDLTQPDFPYNLNHLILNT